MVKGGGGAVDVRELRPGDHLCCLYEGEDEHRAVIAPFLLKGLELGEKIVYIVDAHTAETVLDYLRELGVDVETSLLLGQFRIVTQNETYLREGFFDPDAMIELLRSEEARALSDGYPALRISGEMTWALKNLPGSDRLMEYEAKLNDFFPGSRCMAICQYDRRRFDSSVLLDVLMTHPLVVVGTKTLESFYYTPPKAFLSDRPGARLDQWLSALMQHQQKEESQHRSEELLRAVIETLPVGLWVTDADGRIVHANRESRRIWGGARYVDVPEYGQYKGWWASTGRPVAAEE